MLYGQPSSRHMEMVAPLYPCRRWRMAPPTSLPRAPGLAVAAAAPRGSWSRSRTRSSAPCSPPRAAVVVGHVIKIHFALLQAPDRGIVVYVEVRPGRRPATLPDHTIVALAAKVELVDEVYRGRMTLKVGAFFFATKLTSARDPALLVRLYWRQRRLDRPRARPRRSSRTRKSYGRTSYS